MFTSRDNATPEVWECQSVFQIPVLIVIVGKEIVLYYIILSRRELLWFVFCYLEEGDNRMNPILIFSFSTSTIVSVYSGTWQGNHGHQRDVP